MKSVFYHVTFKTRLDSILSEGIRCQGVHHIYSSFIRKHHDSLYAFSDISDALKWWDYQEKEKIEGWQELQDEGEQVIIEFEDNIFLYHDDEHREMKKDYPSAKYKVPGENVKPEQIVKILDYDYVRNGLLKDEDDGGFFLAYKDDDKELTFEEWKNNYSI